CSACKSYSPLGSASCQACGAPLTAALGGPPPPVYDRAKQTMVDADPLHSTLPDLGDHLAHLRRSATKVDEQIPPPAAEPPAPSASGPPKVDSDAHTFIFSTGEPRESSEPSENTDPLASSTPQGETKSIEEAEAQWRRESAETNMLPGVAG